jgi:hypothetical protein
MTCGIHAGSVLLFPYFVYGLWVKEAMYVGSVGY